MPALPPSTYRLIFERAISEELGVVVPTNNPIYLTSMLYNYRNNVDPNPAFRDIAIIKPGEGDRLLLVRKSAELEA